MLVTLLPLISACIIALIAIPAIIRIAQTKRLVDDPTGEARKIHRYLVPNLGGVAVFSTFALVSCFFMDNATLPDANFIFASGIIVFTIGLKDDLIALDPYKKFAAQFLAAFIVIHFADIRITNFFGVMDLYKIGPVLSYIFTSLVIVFVINAFNLIDGINGLLGLTTLLICTIYGILYALMDDTGYAAISFCMVGAILGFLYYNFRAKARIFMGDAGAYSIGFVIALLSIHFVRTNDWTETATTLPMIQAAPAVVIALLVIPVFDTFRVFSLRIVRGTSPFTADRKHLHHRLLDLGLTHLQTAALIVTAHISIIALALCLQKNVRTPELLIIITLTIICYHTMLWVYEVRNADRILALQRLRDMTAHLPRKTLMADLEQKNHSDVDSSLAAVHFLAAHEDFNSPQAKEAARRFAQEVLDNLERSKN